MAAVGLRRAPFAVLLTLYSLLILLVKSQEVELVVEGLDALAAPGLDGPFLTPFWLVSRLVPPVGDSDRLIELCDLVSVLCGSWNQGRC